MKLFEMNKKPERAGVAVFIFKECFNGLPSRIRHEIFLPNDPELEYFSLEEGIKFLVRYKIGGNFQYWFGGTEHAPFLVRLDKEAFNAFVLGGENGFFEALQPTVINELKKELDCELGVLRQGDIFAIRLSQSWETLKHNAKMFTGKVFDFHKVERERVFGTRHTISGICINDFPLWGDKYLVAEGLIECPDHPSLQLEGPHLITQTQHLATPREAD